MDERAEAARLRAALQWIIDNHFAHPGNMVEVARAALAADKGPVVRVVGGAVRGFCTAEIEGVPNVSIKGDSAAEALGHLLLEHADLVGLTIERFQ